MTDITTTIRITSPYFVAAVVVDRASGRVIQAAPILHYMRKWTVEHVMAYIDSKGWEWEAT